MIRVLNSFKEIYSIILYFMCYQQLNKIVFKQLKFFLSSLID